MKLRCGILIPDTHRPYHNKKAYDLVMEVASYLCIDFLYIKGDYADFYSVMSHQKDPRVGSLLTAEILDVNAGLDQIDKLFPKADKVFIEGNHEYRLERYLIGQAPALFGITSTEHLLDLNRRKNWKFIPYGPNQMTSVDDSYLYARHEPLASSAKATASKALCSLTYGHIHRIEESHLVGLDGTNHVCFSDGWLGDKRKDKVFDYVKGHHQWQLGFTVLYTEPKTRLFYHHKVHILEKAGRVSCVVNGKRFQL